MLYTLEGHGDGNPEAHIRVGTVGGGVLVDVGPHGCAGTFAAILLVDRIGRKWLFLEGGIQMALAEVGPLPCLHLLVAPPHRPAEPLP